MIPSSPSRRPDYLNFNGGRGEHKGMNYSQPICSICLTCAAGFEEKLHPNTFRFHVAKIENSKIFLMPLTEPFKGKDLLGALSSFWFMLS